MDGREGHLFGRRTLPEMDLASLACAIQNLWLAARAEGLGMAGCRCSIPWRWLRCSACRKAPPVAILCLGPVHEFYPAPMLALEGWTTPRLPHELVFENGWR